MQTHPLHESSEQPLPHNYEAEQATIGAILLNDQAIDSTMQILKTSDFYLEQHQIIMEAINEIHADGKPIDLIVLTDRLKSNGQLARIGGVSYLARVASSVPTAANVQHYASIVSKCALLRKLIFEGERVSRSGFESDDVHKAILESQAQLDQLLEESSPRKSGRSLRKILIECYEDIETKFTNRDGTGVSGIPSGFRDIDKLTGGFQDDDFIVIGARPSVGKTALALNIARNAAAETRKTVAVFSLEMSEKQLVNRMIAAESLIVSDRIRSGYLYQDDWERLTGGLGVLDQYPIWIDDTPGATVPEIKAKCRAVQREQGLGLIIIDYLQLIEVVKRSSNRQQEISEISRDLKKMAKELGVPVIALSQLSRAVEQRQDKRPMMSDLRESGSIEQDADLVAFLYRDDYYNSETEKKNIIEFILAKQRNGQVGTVELIFMKDYNKFANLAS